MHFCRFISFLLLPIVIHSFRIQNYHIANSESKRKCLHSILASVEFRARIKSTEDFETTANPIPVLIGFSSEVMTFDETHILVVDPILCMNDRQLMHIFIRSSKSLPRSMNVTLSPPRLVLSPSPSPSTQSLHLEICWSSLLHLPSSTRELRL